MRSRAYRQLLGRQASVLTGLFIRPLFPIHRNHWQYGYYSDQNDWSDSRLDGVPSALRVVLSGGVTPAQALSCRGYKASISHL